MEADDADREFMKLAISESRKSRSEANKRVHPLVGVVVANAGKVVAAGHRGEKKLGEHAEYTVLERKLGDELIHGATVYTTLEPCTTRNHPKVPCAEWLIDRKVARVFIGMLDPNPAITGKGQRRLREANIETQMFPNDLAKPVEELNRHFTRSFAKGQPEVGNDQGKVAKSRRRMFIVIGVVAAVVCAFALYQAFRSTTPPQSTASGDHSSAPMTTTSEASDAHPDFILSMLGGNIFVSNQDPTFTGIALDVRIRNAGSPSIATDWTLAVSPHGAHPTVLRPMKPPPLLTLEGSPSVRLPEEHFSLERLATAAPLKAGDVPIESAVLFFVNLPKGDVLASDSVLVLSVSDFSGRVFSHTQRMGDWPKSKPVVPAAPVPPPLVPAPVVTNPPGTNGSSELSPGLQDVLAKELVKIGPHKIQLVVVGTNIHARNLFDQLRDVFAKSKWEVNAVLIGQASIIGMNFPDSSYITGSDIASPLIDRVFTTFAQKIGIKLLLTPNGFDATSGQRAEIAIVLR